MAPTLLMCHRTLALPSCFVFQGGLTRSGGPRACLLRFSSSITSSSPAPSASSTCPTLLSRHAIRTASISFSTSNSSSSSSSSTSAAVASTATVTADAYQHTLCLPKTALPMRAQGAEREPLIQKNCMATVYEQQYRERKEAPLFILHDGPPFANGPPHMGHALNKVLKDIVARFQMLQGARVSYIPGWDCHGLPIELKALEAYAKKSAASAGGAATSDSKKKKSSPPMSSPSTATAPNSPPATASSPPGSLQSSAVALRKYARSFALEAREVQKRAFQRWGVLGDWERPYLTMDPAYEVEQLKVFKVMFDKGLIYRGRKPVFWSPSSRTALAEAELEYMDLPAHSAYVAMPLQPHGPLPSTSAPSPTALSAHTPHSSAFAAGLPVYAVIWTTTPWTLPANQAISVHPQLAYVFVKAIAKGGSSPAVFLLAQSRVEAVKDVLFEDGAVEVVGTASGRDLVQCTYAHPIRHDTDPLPIITAEFVTDSSGTGLVHTAPAHGAEDHLACVRAGISSRFHLVDERGAYVKEAGPRLEGKLVLEAGNTEVLDMLREHGALLEASKLIHRYPVDWRTKKPVLLRETMQWFADLSALRHSATSALGSVQMVPEVGRRRLEAMLATRTEWCISRQRVWGVPIPVFYNEHGEPLLTDASFAHVAKCFREHGSDCWWSLPIEELLAPEYRADGHTYTTGRDTMDVWFDSGSSWRSAVQQREGPGVVADVVLEGSDQHRGWFQSSLLTAVAAGSPPVAPYKCVITHGFVLDEGGHKMSKSLGNGLDPDVVVMGGGDKKAQPAYGADTLRVWVASTHFANDVLIGVKSLGIAAETLRKLRNTARFMLGNLYDFHVDTHTVPRASMVRVDQYLLHRLAVVDNEIQEAYRRHAFYDVLSILMAHTNSDLSAFYYEVTKDRLYAELPTSLSRRSAQTVLHHAAACYMRWLAPVAPHLAEEIHAFRDGRDPAHTPGPSVMLGGWAPCQADWLQPQLGEVWDVVRSLRRAVFKAVNDARQAGTVQDIGDCAVTIMVPLTTMEVLQSPDAQGAASTDIFGSAELVVVPGDASVSALPGMVVSDAATPSQAGAVGVRVEKTKHGKCPRCWRHNMTGAQTVCTRCSSVLDQRS